MADIGTSVALQGQYEDTGYQAAKDIAAQQSKSQENFFKQARQQKEEDLKKQEKFNAAIKNLAITPNKGEVLPQRYNEIHNRNMEILREAVELRQKNPNYNISMDIQLQEKLRRNQSDFNIYKQEKQLVDEKVELMNKDQLNYRPQDYETAMKIVSGKVPLEEGKMFMFEPKQTWHAYDKNEAWLKKVLPASTDTYEEKGGIGTTIKSTLALNTPQEIEAAKQGLLKDLSTNTRSGFWQRQLVLAEDTYEGLKKNPQELIKMGIDINNITPEEESAFIAQLAVDNVIRQGQLINQKVKEEKQLRDGREKEDDAVTIGTASLMKVDVTADGKPVEDKVKEYKMRMEAAKSGQQVGVQDAIDVAMERDEEKIKEIFRTEQFYVPIDFKGKFAVANEGDVYYKGITIDKNGNVTSLVVLPKTTQAGGIQYGQEKKYIPVNSTEFKDFKAKIGEKKYNELVESIRKQIGVSGSRDVKKGESKKLKTATPNDIQKLIPLFKGKTREERIKIAEQNGIDPKTL